MQHESDEKKEEEEEEIKGAHFACTVTWPLNEEETRKKKDFSSRFCVNCVFSHPHKMRCKWILVCRVRQLKIV